MTTARDWNVDERSRAQTRGLLMALSRKRDWYFVISILPALIGAILTLGLRPPMQAAGRFGRWRRLEWLTFAELARWMRDRTGDPIAEELIQYGEGAIQQPMRIRTLRAYQLAAIAMLITVGVTTHWSLRALAATVFAPLWQPLTGPSTAPLICGYSFVLAFAWFWLLVQILRHQASVIVWLTRCCTLLAAHDKRPVVLPNRSLPWWYILMAIVVGTVAAPWIGALLVVIGAQNRYIIATRAVRLAFIERMLEWMDQSGLPMEFDVEEMAPDAIAATLA